MKNVLIVVVVVALGYFLYGKFAGGSQESASRSYSLATVAERPIPKDAFFALWTQQALATCADAQGRYNLSPAECEDKVKSKSPSCSTELSPNTPAHIDTVALARSLGRQYLHCVSPYYYCNGVEVKSEEDARRHCQ